MILFINTSQTNLIQLKLIINDKIIGSLDNHDEFKHSELLLGMLDKLLNDSRFALHATRYIVVVSGPGAFSALRLGIATANTLAWSLKIPIMELNVDEVSNDQKLIANINTKIKRLPLDAARGKKDLKIGDFSPIVPKYGREPNITQAKNS